MDLLSACQQAFYLLVSGNPELWRIVAISLRVALTGLVLATPLATIIGFVLATFNFPGRRVAVIILQSLLSFPTVVVGLILYMLLTRNGPLGSLHLLFTQEAMILGEAVIVFPVLAAHTLAAVQGADSRVRETAISLGAGPWRVAFTTLREVRFSVVAGVLNGFGRAISEVGCAMMVGGNIDGLTRNITTAIALETSKGDFVQGIALGVVLLTLALAVNFALAWLQGEGEGHR
jgi:tungstate transport system permease protein